MKPIGWKSIKRIFEKYPWRGRLPIRLQRPARNQYKEVGKNKWSLLDYGRPIAALCDYTCVYCGRDLAGDFGGFLSAELEHVVPRAATRNLGFDERWIENDSNAVLACSACNSMVANPKPVRDFLAGERPPEFPLDFLQAHMNDPDYLLRSGVFEEFMVQRDRVFDLKTDYVAEKRSEKQEAFKSLLRGETSGNKTADIKWEIGERTDHACAYCGRKLSSNLDAWLLSQIEHVVPRLAVHEFGYPRYLIESRRNQVLACRMCNIFAGDQRVREFLKRIGPMQTDLDFDDVFEGLLEAKRVIVREKRRRYRAFFNRHVRRKR